MSVSRPLTNSDLAELLSRRVREAETEQRGRALRRAARAALLWEEEAATLHSAGRDLTELRAIGPWLASMIRGWIEDPPEVLDPPEERRDFLTTARARALVAEHPERRRAVSGDLQMHTTWSDGRDSLEVMGRAAAVRGYAYAALTDHSGGQRIPRGMDAATIKEQAKHVRRFNEELEGEGQRFRFLHGLEMNLDPHGNGDTDPEALAGLDLVLGAFHSRLRVEEDQTERYLAAVRNPSLDVLAHPRGRRFDARRGLNADWPRVFTVAAAAGTALEIDAFPDRQDLQVELLTLVRESGAWVSYGTDAHRTGELAHMELAVAAAALADFPRERVINELPIEEIRERPWRRA